MHTLVMLRKWGDLSMSSHETPGGMQTLHATQWISPEISIQNLKNIKFWCVSK